MTTLIDTPVDDVMTQAFLDYSLSVILGRSLPDARDGLKPVHRRILYAMYEDGNTYNRAFRKSAKMVGNVLGKYHPHGDQSIYDAGVRMAQPFTMGAVLIDGQGNFGSVDKDPAAAMRYTEMRLTRLGGEFFDDIEKETVAFSPNYDNSEREPDVLPAPLPNLLVNGTDGIAVGMATDIPPHNLREVVDTTLLLMDRPDAPLAEILELLKAPDFPTGGLVHGLEGFAQAIENGSGKVKLRSRWHEEDRGRGAKAIVIDELPHRVVKAALVEKIADLVKEKQVEGIVDLRDESNKEGIRVWIALQKDASPEAIFALLANKTDLEVAVPYNCTVVDGGRPRVLGLRALILRWIKFREEVVLARHVYNRKQALARLHILEGFLAALGMLDQVIAIIRGAESPGQAKSGLMELLSIDDGQAQAVLDLRLQKLTGMEIDAIRAEHAEVTAKIAGLTEIIENPERIRGVIRDELGELAKRYGKDRLTEIATGLSEIPREELVPREDVLIAMTQGGYIKRMPANALQRQNRGTRGKTSMAVGEDDNTAFLRQTRSLDSVMVFAPSGQVYGIKAHRIPEGTLATRGRHVKNVFEGLDEELSAVLALPEKDPETSVLMVTRSGQVKRTAIEEFDGATRKGGVRGIGLEEGDSVIGAFTVRDQDDIILMSSAGLAIRFAATDIRIMGRAAGGVRGMRLYDGEFLVGAAVVPGGEAPEMHLLFVGNGGIGKRTAVAEFPLQGRAGGGVAAFKQNDKTGALVAAMSATGAQDLILLASNAVSTRVAVNSIRESGRSASGVVLLKLDEGQRLVSAFTVVGETEQESGETPAAVQQDAHPSGTSTQ